MSENKNSCLVVRASDYLLLDSNVETGGGTDQTAEVQQILDKALEHGSLFFVVDGAILVSQIVIHSNTTVYCLNNTCGFFQKPFTNNALVRNAGMSFTEINDENITLDGGTYNFNGPNQERTDLPPEQINGGLMYGLKDTFDLKFGFHVFEHVHMGIKMCGVRNLIMRNIRTVDQRIYAVMVACFEHALLENIAVDLPHIRAGENQDGIHFQGPGCDLVVRNIRGCSGDDFMALTSDEFDYHSALTDVLIDGIYLENADQGIRLLSRNDGLLDRIIIRNVYGNYKSFGFYINPWYGYGMGEGEGNIGSVTFENIHLTQTEHKYLYTSPFLFRVGGRVGSLTLRNIEHRCPNDNRPIVDVGHYYCHAADENFAEIGNLTVDGVEIHHDNTCADPIKYFQVDGKIGRMTVRNVTVDGTNADKDTLITISADSQIEHFSVTDVSADQLNVLENQGTITKKKIDELF